MPPARRARPVFALLLAALLAAPAPARRGRRWRAARTGADSSSMRVTRDIPYASIEGVDPNLLSLDVYSPKDGDAHPVMVMVHGGGWRRGDKASPGVAREKSRHFVREGFVFVSLNYRLSPAVRHPAHVEDVARALAWLHDNVAEYGGDPERLHLMGHSAGAHLASLVAVDERYLAREGKEPSILRTVVVLDTAAYDIPRRMAEVHRPRMRALYESAFGRDPRVLTDASPVNHVAPGKGIPPILLFYTSSRLGAAHLAPAFVARLREAGVPAGAMDTVTLSHREINTRIGTPGDGMTRWIMRFLRGEDPTKFPAQLSVGARE